MFLYSLINQLHETFAGIFVEKKLGFQVRILTFLCDSN